MAPKLPNIFRPRGTGKSQEAEILPQNAKKISVVRGGPSQNKQPPINRPSISPQTPQVGGGLGQSQTGAIQPNQPVQNPMDRIDYDQQQIALNTTYKVANDGLGMVEAGTDSPVASSGQIFPDFERFKA